MAKEPEIAEPALESGYHVYVDGKHNSGPYLTEEDATAFVDGHLADRKTTISFVEMESE